MIADEYVDREFGTGALKITPAHDPNDYEIGKRHGLDVINIMNNDGTLNANAGPYCDMDRSDVRSKLWADMEVRSPLIREILGAKHFACDRLKASPAESWMHMPFIVVGERA